MIGSHSLTYVTIEPDLKKMDILAEIILQDLEKNPTSWIGEFRQRKMELIESFYLTVTDKDKVGKQSRDSFFRKHFLLKERAQSGANLGWLRIQGRRKKIGQCEPPNSNAEE